MLACSKVEKKTQKLHKSFCCPCLMTSYTFDFQGDGHIFCPLVDYVGVHVKPVPYDQDLKIYGDLIHLQYDFAIYP